MSSSQSQIQSIQEKFSQAQKLQSEGKVSEAIAECWTILELDKKNLATWHLLAQVLEKQGDFAGAIECYRKSIELDAQPPFWVYRHFGFALNHEGLLDEAVVAYQKAIALQSEDATIHGLLGQVFGRKGELEGAIECYQKAIELSENLPVWVYLNLGDGLSQIDRVDEAISAYEKALALEPENEGIVRLLEVATARKEANEGDRCYRAKQLQREGQLEEALAEFRAVLEVDGSNLVALHQVAQICETQGKWEEAVEGYRKAIEIDAESPFWVYRHLGFALSQLGDLDEAVAAYEKAVELNPEDGATQSLLGRINTNKSCLEEMLFEQTSAINMNLNSIKMSRFLSEFDPENHQIKNAINYLNFANHLKLERKLDQAILACQKAIELSPENSMIYIFLGQLYGLSGNLDLAISVYKRFLKLLENSQNLLAYKFENFLFDFDWKFYVEFNKELSHIANEEEAYSHYCNIGNSNGYIASEDQFYEVNKLKKDNIPIDFCWQSYLELNSDLQGSLIGKWDAVKHFLQHGIKENRQYSYIELGDAFVEILDFKRAIFAYRKAISFMPEMSVAYEKLGDTLAQLGLINEAQDCYKKFLELNFMN